MVDFQTETLLRNLFSHKTFSTAEDKGGSNQKQNVREMMILEGISATSYEKLINVC